MADIPERDLSDQLGISRADLKNFREKMTPLLDWYRRHPGPVMITASGLEKIKANLLTNGAGNGSVSYVNPTPKKRHRLIVIRRCRNLRLVIAQYEDYEEPQEVRVQVKNSAKIHIGQVLECERETKDYFIYRGRVGRQRYGRP